MTPAYFDREHMLLRAQLKCLSQQTCKEFDVWIIDPHYQKRKDVVPELASRFRLEIKHVPYATSTRIAKRIDCSIFNAGFCYSNAPKNARYSCYRFARPGWTQAILEARGNVDFYFLAVGPSRDDPVKAELQTRQKTVWDFKDEDFAWDKVPQRSGYTEQGKPASDPATDLGAWLPFADKDSAEAPVPYDCYGNIAWKRSEWLEINGTNEVITNSGHWEDQDFTHRARMAGQTCSRRTKLLYRLDHPHGPFPHRSTVQVDVPFSDACCLCVTMLGNVHSDVSYGSGIMDRVTRGELVFYDQFQAWVCKDCRLSGPFYDGRGIEGFFAEIKRRGDPRAPVLQAEMIGRNLQTLAFRMDKCLSLPSKVEVFNSSWSDPVFYDR